MASNKVQIQVELKGAQQVNKQLDSIEKNSVDLSEGFKGVGESFKSVGDVVKAQGGMMGDAFGVLGESVGAITDSIGSFKGAMEVAGQTGGKAWLAMLGPIAAVVSGVSLAIEAYREFSGANRAAEDAAENMAAAASDTASRLEAMVEAGVDLSSGALKEFISVNERARLAMEETIKSNEKRTVSDQKVKNAIQSVKDAEESLFFTDMRVAMAKRDLELATTEYNKALDEQVAKSKEANKLNKEAFELQELLIKSSKEFLDIYLQERERQDELTLRITNTTNIRDKERKIIEDTLAKKKLLIDEEIRYKDAIRVLEGQLSKGVLSQELFDASTKQLKINLRDTAKQIKETNDILEPYVKNLEASKEAQEGLNSLSKESFARQNAMRIEDLNYQLQILNTRFQDLKDVTTAEGFKFFKEFEQNLSNYTEGLTYQIKKTFDALDLLERMDVYQFSTIPLGGDFQYLVKKSEEELDRAEKFILEMGEDFFNELESRVEDRLSMEVGLSLDLIHMEEQRLLQMKKIREEEIRGMDVSNKRKKELLKRAEDDYQYSLKKVEERTIDSVNRQIDASYRFYIENQKISSEQDIKNAESVYAEKALERQIKRDKFLAEMEYRKDLQELTAQSNRKLIEDDLHRIDKELEHQLSLNKTKNNALKLYGENLQILRDDFSKTMNKQEKEALDIQIKQNFYAQTELDWQRDSFEKETLNKKYILNMKLRDADLELLVQKKKFESRFSQIFLSEEQIRANASIEFAEQRRNLAKEEHAKRISEIDREIQDVKDKQQKLIDETSALTGALGTSDYKTKMSEEVQAYIEELGFEIDRLKLAEEEKLEIKQRYMELDQNNANEFRARTAQLDREHYQAVGSLIKDFSDSSAQAFINAGVAAAFAGESISDAIRTTLRGLAQEATARALYEGAAALGSLAIGDGKGATLHANSAAAFGIAAAAMGALTAAVGVPGGSSGGGGTTSPTGLSQTSEAPQRESAKTEAMVFNINFGNAVIYDTRAAAERAMAERVMELGVRARRGYNPPRPRI